MECSLPQAFLTFFILSFVYNLYLLLVNVRIAHRIGLPYIIFPISSENTLLTLLLGSPIIRRIISLLPLSLSDRIFSQSPVTRWRVKYRKAEKYGGVHCVVTPKGVTVDVMDAAVMYEVMSERERFVKEVGKYEALKLYGPNIIVAEHSDWVHHRKHTVPFFNERKNTLVWKQALGQTVDMMQRLQSEEKNQKEAVMEVISASEPDLEFMRLTLHVLSSAAFGIPSSDFSKAKPDDKKETKDVPELFVEGRHPPGFRFTYTESLNFISFNVLPHLLINGLPTWFPNLTKTIQKHRWVHADYTKYLKALVSMTKEGQGSSQDNVLAMMGTSTGKDAGLTEAEIRGNLFTFGLAGHETTARTLNFAMIEVALNPKVQKMLQRNIDEVMEGKPSDPLEWVYEDNFPKLKLILFLMLETLRVYSPIQFLPKITAIDTHVTYKGRTFGIPKGTHVDLGVCNIHYAPKYYGPNAPEFDIMRWDRKNNDSFLAQNEGKPQMIGPGLESVDVHKPARGAFVAFSDGLRSCMGRKFALVEFTAVTTFLLRYYDVEIARKSGETMGGAKSRARGVVKESYAGLTLGPKEKVGLVFTKRK